MQVPLGTLRRGKVRDDTVKRMHGVHIGDNSRVLKVSQFDTFTSTLELQKHPQITLKTLFKSTPYNFLSNTKRSTTDRLLESQARQKRYQLDRINEVKPL